MTFTRGLILFATADNDMSISAAKEYIKSMKFTSMDVRIVKREGQIHIEAIRDLD